MSYLVCGALIASLLLIPLKKEIHIVGGAITLTFFKDRPSKNEVEFFINEIIRISKQLLLKKYARIDPDIPEDVMMTQLNWLKNRELLTEEEYADLKMAYKTQRLMNS
jgi:hypothetical protein